MTRHSLLYLLITVLITGLVPACNSESENFQSESDLGSCAVTSFSLVKDDSVLKALDSVFFSIDLVKARIYNADSLPVGTDVSRLVVNIGTSSATAIDLTYRLRGTDRDTTVSFIDSPKDSINFADGPVKLFVRAADNIQTRTYSIEVNVHKSVPDTLCWSSIQTGALFTSVNTPFYPKQQTHVGVPGTDDIISVATNVEENDTRVILYERRNLSDVARCAEAGTMTTLPEGFDITSFTALDANTFLIIAGGKLYANTTGLHQGTWTDTGERFDYIYGVSDGKVLGARHDADGWKHVSYPAGDVTPVPADCPVVGTSPLVNYTSKWSSSAMALMAGGRNAAGEYTGDSWAFDGKKWGKVSTEPLPAGEGYAIVPYNTPRVNPNNWNVTDRSALLAMGSRGMEEGDIACSKTVYISYDWGITWREADTYLQFPEQIPAFYNVKAFVGYSTLTVSDAASAPADGWNQVEVRRLPAWCKVVPAAPMSRVTVAPEEWECPYIYLFGGADAHDKQFNIIRRGVIARYTFNPLY